MDQRDDQQIETNTSSEIDLAQALQIVAEQIQALAAEQPRVRTLVRGLGQALLAIAAQADESDAVTAHTEHAAAQIDGVADIHDEPAAQHDTPAPPLYTTPSRENGSALNDRMFVPITPTPRWNDRAFDQVTDDDLAVMITRCQLKAEAARWSIERAAMQRDGADFFAEIEPRDRDLIDRAKQPPDCYLWMYRRDSMPDEDVAFYHQLAGCFDAAAAAIEFLCVALTPGDDEQPSLEQAMLFAAEAQSALRVAVADLSRNADRDQVRLFLWLKQRSSDDGIFIRRFMRADDSADPLGWFDLQTRIAQANEALQTINQHKRRERKLLNKARYHLKLISDNPNVERLIDWQKVVDTINELVEGGTPSSSRDIRDLLLPVVDDIPGTLVVPKHFHRVLSDIDAYLASEPSNVPPASNAGDSADLRQARELLRGRAVVLIGGVRRPDAADQLQAALGLSELIWIETREHQTHTVFEPYVARDDVALVLLAIRWSSHGFSDVQTFCERYGKALVRLPKGYNPNQVAYQIVNQVSQQLVEASDELPELDDPA